MLPGEEAGFQQWEKTGPLNSEQLPHLDAGRLIHEAVTGAIRSALLMFSKITLNKTASSPPLSDRRMSIFT